MTATATVQFRSWDNAANAEQAHSQVVSVAEPPDATPPGHLNATDNVGGWGVATTYYTTDGSTDHDDQWLYEVPLMQADNMTGTYYATTSDSDAGLECCMSWNQLPARSTARGRT